jgi:hypothetical protein
MKKTKICNLKAVPFPGWPVVGEFEEGMAHGDIPFHSQRYGQVDGT